MDSTRFNKLVDRVRVIRLSNERNYSDGWESTDLLQKDMDINAVIEKFCMTRSGLLNPYLIYNALSGSTTVPEIDETTSF
ncbi:MAG TPA: hypothetical protein VKA08_07530 [Balneolales bacterium]|nr:hypothetical protein [Balneolales bacterium]